MASKPVCAYGPCLLVLSREDGELFPIQPSYNVFLNSLLGTSKFLALRQSNFLRPASNNPDQNAVVGRSYFRFDLKGSGMPEREVGGWVQLMRSCSPIYNGS